jgi:hypothetical protein
MFRNGSPDTMAASMAIRFGAEQARQVLGMVKLRSPVFPYVFSWSGTHVGVFGDRPSTPARAEVFARRARNFFPIIRLDHAYLGRLIS